MKSLISSIRTWWSSGAYISMAPILIGFVAGTLTALWVQYDDMQYAITHNLDFYDPSYDREDVIFPFFCVWVTTSLLNWIYFFRKRS